LIVPWHLYALSAMLGLTYAFEIPARQAMLADLAGADLDNVVALNATVVTVMRVLGPFFGGLIVAAVGEGWCFTSNAVSFVFVLGALAMMQLPKTKPKPKSGAVADILEGLGYATKTPMI